MTIKIYEALDIINIHVSEGVEIAPNELYRIDEKYIKFDDLIETDKLSVEKLQERCDRYEKALEDIRTNTPIQELLNLPYGCACHEIANDALAAIGGDDEL